MKHPATPSLLPPDFKQIPELLHQGPWCVWEAVWNAKRGKYDKIPSNGRFRISTKRRDQWLTYADAKTVYEASPHKWGGVGRLVLPGDGLVFVDIDGDTDAAKWQQQFPTYCETSPSGNGLRLISLGSVTRDIDKPIEVYSGHAPRFVTITGQVVR